MTTARLKPWMTKTAPKTKATPKVENPRGTPIILRPSEMRAKLEAANKESSELKSQEVNPQEVKPQDLKVDSIKETQIAEIEELRLLLELVINNKPIDAVTQAKIEHHLSERHKLVMKEISQQKETVQRDLAKFLEMSVKLNREFESIQNKIRDVENEIKRLRGVSDDLIAAERKLFNKSDTTPTLR